MANRSGTDQLAAQQDQAQQKADQQQAERALQQKIKAERQKREQAKQLRNKERKKEEDERKRQEDEAQRAASMAATPMETQVISPKAQMDTEMQTSVTNSTLLSLMNGDPSDTVDPNNTEDRLPAKTKPRKLGTTDPKPVQPTKQTVKGVLRTGFKINNHIHNHPRVLAETSIVLKSDTPVQ